MTLPLIEVLHQWRPELRQSVLVEAPFAPVFLDHPAVHKVLILKKGKGTDRSGWTRLRTIQEVRKRAYPAILNLHGGTTSMLFTISGGARLRIGQEGHRGSWLYTQRIPSSSAIWNRQRLHTVEHQLSLIRWLDIPLHAHGSTLHVSETARNRIEGRLANSVTGDFALIHPTATLRTKQWTLVNFAKLADWLTTTCGMPVIFTAAPHEKPVLEQIGRMALKQHTYWADLPLAELFAVIEKCRLFVGCDSGPTHAAAALKRPVVVVWGSSNFDAWHPWGTEYEAVGSHLPCMPCPGYRCDKFTDPKCILDVPLSAVSEACSRFLNRVPKQQA